MERNVLNFQNQEEQDDFWLVLKDTVNCAYETKIEENEKMVRNNLLFKLISFYFFLDSLKNDKIIYASIFVVLFYMMLRVTMDKMRTIENHKDKQKASKQELDAYQKDFSEEEIKEMISEAVNRILESDKIEI